MKRTLLEIVLVLSLAAAGYFGWTNLQKGKLATAEIAAIQTKVDVAEELLKDSEKEVETAENALEALEETLDPLKEKALELDAVKAAIANGPLLQDVESLYKKDKKLSVERQLSLGALRMLVKGSDDPSATEAFNKALQMADWGSRKNSICAAQIGLAAAGQKVKVMSECAVQPPSADAVAGHGDPKAHGAAPAASAHASPAGDKAHGKDVKTAAAHAAPHWGYEGAMGPDKWGKEFPTCGKGQSQSPLNIKSPFVKGRISVSADYKAGPLRMLNNGHTIQVNVTPGSKLRIDGVPHDLLQFHFHRPSEEHIDGKPSAMVIHFVHKNAAGKLAVLGVLLKEGNENPGIKTLWANAPAAEGPEVVLDDVSFNPGNLLPREFDFFSYEGSLTTPPCTEGVRFFILKTPVNISREQISGFPFKMNARPVQPQNGRIITSG
jgi:carbonic anhydrase